MEKTYSYPDANDALTAALIRQKEPYPNYWELSEHKILKKIQQEIKKHPMPQSSWLLDAGCGTGRLLPTFESCFSNILAVDPDVAQIEKAKKTARDGRFEGKVTFEVASAEQLKREKESIDVVLCSHVIQHATATSVEKILGKFYDVLRPNGFVFILTAHSTKKTDYYVKEQLINSKNVAEKIGEDEFNCLINNNQNILPIHFFTEKTLNSALVKHGFKLLDFKVYHVLGKSKLFAPSEDRDEVANGSQQRKSKFGRDMLIIAQNPLNK
jgi:ubiquinone/menaquinone biosynthesis C-methylase UbiE